MGIRKHVSQLEFFEGIDPKTVEKLIKCGKIMDVPKGTLLIRARESVEFEYTAQGVKDIESACPYRVYVEGAYKYWPGGVEITITSADGSQKEVIYENSWNKFKALSKKYGRNAKVSFKVDKDAYEWTYRYTAEYLKKHFNHVEGSFDN